MILFIKNMSRKILNIIFLKFLFNFFIVFIYSKLFLDYKLKIFFCNYLFTSILLFNIFIEYSIYFNIYIQNLFLSLSFSNIQ